MEARHREFKANLNCLRPCLKKWYWYLKIIFNTSQWHYLIWNGVVIFPGIYVQIVLVYEKNQHSQNYCALFIPRPMLVFFFFVALTSAQPKLPFLKISNTNNLIFLLILNWNNIPHHFFSFRFQIDWLVSSSVSPVAFLVLALYFSFAHAAFEGEC